MSALGITMGSAGQSAGLLRGQLTLVGFAALGASAALTKTFADMERTATIASIAAGEGATAMTRMTEEAAMLGRELREKPSDMLELGRAISFFGLQTDSAQAKVAEFSTRLSQITGDDPDQIATNLIRLLNITRRTGETVDDAAQRFDSLAGAVFKTGINVTAGVGELLRFLEIFQLIGVVSEATETQIVALAGSIADLTPRMREIVTTATQRIFLTEEFEALNRILDDSEGVMEKFPRLVAASADEIGEFRRQRPIDFFKAVAIALDEAQAQDKFLSEMKELGVGQLRSARGLSALIANLDRLDELQANVADSADNVNAIMKASTEVQATLSQRLTGLAGAMQEFAFQGGMVLEGVIGPMVDGLTRLFQVITENEDALKVMTSFLTVIPLGIAAGGLFAILRRSGFGGGLRNLITGNVGRGVQGVPGNAITENQLNRLFQGTPQQQQLATRIFSQRELRAVSRVQQRQAEQAALQNIVRAMDDNPALKRAVAGAKEGGGLRGLLKTLEEMGGVSDDVVRSVRDAVEAQNAYSKSTDLLKKTAKEATESLDELALARAQRFRKIATTSPLFSAVPGEIAAERLAALGLTEGQAGVRAGFAAATSNLREGISRRLARSRIAQGAAGIGRAVLLGLGLERGSATRELVGSAASRTTGFFGGSFARFRAGFGQAQQLQQLTGLTPEQARALASGRLSRLPRTATLPGPSLGFPGVRGIRGTFVDQVTGSRFGLGNVRTGARSLGGLAQARGSLVNVDPRILQTGLGRRAGLTVPINTLPGQNLVIPGRQPIGTGAPARVIQEAVEAAGLRQSIQAGGLAARVGAFLGGRIPTNLASRLGISQTAASGRAISAVAARQGLAPQFLSAGERAGARGLVAGRGVIGRAALPGIARIAGTGVAARVGSLAVPGLNLLSILGLLAPVLGTIGDAFDSLAERGGALGIVFNTLSILFRSAELLGRSFNFAFDLLIKGIGKFFELLDKIPLVGTFLDMISDFLGGVSDALDRANESELLRGSRSVEQMSNQVRRSAGGGLVGTGQPMPDQGIGFSGIRDVNITVEGGEGVDESTRKARDVVVDAVWAASRSS